MKIAFHPATPANLRNIAGMRGTPMSFGLDLRIAEFISPGDGHHYTTPASLYPGDYLDVLFHVALDTRSMFITGDDAGTIGMAPLLIPRSGLGTKGITLANTVGLIDADYTQMLRGRLQLAHWAEPIDLRQWDRVAQAIFVPVLVPNFEVVDTLDATGRGGFGSTGVA